MRTYNTSTDTTFITFTYAQTTPRNAAATARWLRKHGFKGLDRIINYTFAFDARWSVRPRLLAARLARVARRAEAQGVMVAFITEGGGYPWWMTPILWTTPEDRIGGL